MPNARAKVFTHGGSQAVRLPKEFRVEGKEVDICREGDAIVMRAPKRTPEDMWARIDSRRGDEVFPYHEQAILKDPSGLFDP